MQYFLLTIPTHGRFLAEYVNGHVDRSWCERHPTLANTFNTHKRRFDVYWHISDKGFDPLFSQKLVRLVFNDSSGQYNVLPLNLIHGKDTGDSEVVFRVQWTGAKIAVDEERLSKVRDRVVEPGESMSFLSLAMEQSQTVHMADYFNNWFLVRQDIADRLIQDQMKQLSLFHIDRVPMDSGNFEAKTQNDLNRLIEQGLLEDEARTHVSRFLLGEVTSLRLKKWSEGKYV